MRQPVKQIAYKYCINFAKKWISVPNIVHQLTQSLRCNHWKIQNKGDSHDAINSVRRSTAERLQDNDVSLLWRHSSRSRSRTLEHAYRRPILTVFGEFEPQNVVGHRVDPQKELPYVTTRTLSQNPWTGHFSRRVVIKKIKKRNLIFHVFRQALPTADWHKFGLRVRLVDVINCAKFYRNRLKGLG